jgi:hypothetical protein
MRRSSLAVFLFFVMTVTIYSQARHAPKRNDTWYEQALRHLNPRNIDYGSIWDERKRALLQQLGSRYFHYSFAATAAALILATVLGVERRSHKRALDIAALAIADILRHDEYSRNAADDAIRRYNEHIEGCNRSIESGRDAEAELRQVRKELADTREENRALRSELAKKLKTTAERTPPAATTETPGVPNEKASEPGHLAARIASLEKQLRAERRKHPAKGTSVDDHRA